MLLEGEMMQCSISLFAELAHLTGILQVLSCPYVHSTILYRPDSWPRTLCLRYAIHTLIHPVSHTGCCPTLAHVLSRSFTLPNSSLCRLFIRIQAHLLVPEAR